MMYYEETATENVRCPLRNQDDGAANCFGKECMAWRWRPLMTDDAWQAAVKKAAEELGDKSPGRAKAAAHVNANRAQYGLHDKPFEGYCGLAGKPVV